MRPKQAKQTIQKRSFLLFELLISLALIVLCFFPLIKPHAAMRKADQGYLEQMQLERTAQIAFCYIKEQLYEHRVCWEDLMDQKIKELPKEFFIYIGKNKTKTFRCTYTTTLLDKVNKTSHNKVGLLIEIAIHFSPTLSGQKPFIRTLYLEEYQV